MLGFGPPLTGIISGVVSATGAVLPPTLVPGFRLCRMCVPFANLMQPCIGIGALWWSFAASAVRATPRSLA
ncbi:MAG: hypothetical protein EOP92_17420 [Lysobacteraceae bacterium]|nr:MAG: hypothetical protein EOP92_17420 [Xanthomonadaceae bacterium]